MENNTQSMTLVDILRPLVQFFTNLLGEDGYRWLIAFKRFLRKENPWFRWKTWTCATVGFKEPLVELVSRIEERGFKIRYSDYVPLDLFALENVLQFNDTKEMINFVIVTPKELGLRTGYTKREFFNAALKQDLRPCLSGDILEILAYGEYELNVKDDSLWIAMEPVLIGGSPRHPAMFCVKRFTEYLHLGYFNGDMFQKFTHPSHVNEKHIFRAI